MATILARVPLTATADVLLVATAQGAGPAGWRLGFLGASWTGSVVLKANMAAPGQAQSLTSIPFITESTGATNAADTAITADGTYVVQPTYTAYDLYAVYTHTSGSAVVTVQTQDGATPTGDLTAANLDGSGSQNTFGANVPYTGAYTFPGALAITGALTGVTQLTYSTKIVSTTALATPSALAATAFNAFASTVSGATLMGFGTTGDVTLKNRAGTTVAYVGPNTTKFWCVGDLAIGGALSGVTTAALSSTLTITQATANTAVFARSGYSLTGSDATGAETWAGTLNTTGAPTVLSYALTVTATDAASLYFDYLGGAAGATSLFKMTTAGALTAAGTFASASGITAGSGTAITAGGSLLGLMVSSTASFGVFVGSGAPSISAAKGSLYLRSDGSGVADRAYIATDGAGTWTAISTVA